jgi:hypothetical protein
MLKARYIQTFKIQIKKIIQIIYQISLSLNILYQKINVSNTKRNLKILLYRIKIKLFSWKKLFNFTILGISNY